MAARLMVSTQPGRARALRRKAFLVAFSFVMAWAAAWGAARALSVTVPLARADAIVVMAGSGSFRERAAAAASLYREGVAPVVIVTDEGTRARWFKDQQRNPSFLELSVAVLGARGVPPTAVRQLPAPVEPGTYGELKAVRQFAMGRGMKSVLVVTSDFHTRRVRWAAERLFGGTLRWGVHGVEPRRPAGRAATWWLFPSGWQFVAGEYVKLAYYWIAYSGFSRRS